MANLSNVASCNATESQSAWLCCLLQASSGWTRIQQQAQSSLVLCILLPIPPHHLGCPPLQCCTPDKVSDGPPLESRRDLSTQAAGSETQGTASRAQARD